jgi:hypothetical protein
MRAQRHGTLTSTLKAAAPIEQVAPSQVRATRDVLQSAGRVGRDPFPHVAGTRAFYQGRGRLSLVRMPAMRLRGALASLLLFGASSACEGGSPCDVATDEAARQTLVRLMARAGAPDSVVRAAATDQVIRSPNLPNLVGFAWSCADGSCGGSHGVVYKCTLYRSDSDKEDRARFAGYGALGLPERLLSDLGWADAGERQADIAQSYAQFYYALRQAQIETRSWRAPRAWPMGGGRVLDQWIMHSQNSSGDPQLSRTHEHMSFAKDGRVQVVASRATHLGARTDAGLAPLQDCDLSTAEAARHALARVLEETDKPLDEVEQDLERGTIDVRVPDVPGLVALRMDTCCDGPFFEALMYRCQLGSEEDLSQRVLVDLGWNDATPAQRVALAQAFAYGIYRARGTVETDGGAPHLPRALSRPSAEALPDGGVVLDFWAAVSIDSVFGRQPRYERHRMTFDPAGRCSSKTTDIVRP